MVILKQIRGYFPEFSFKQYAGWAGVPSRDPAKPDHPPTEKQQQQDWQTAPFPPAPPERNHPFQTWGLFAPFLSMVLHPPRPSASVKTFPFIQTVDIDGSKQVSQSRTKVRLSLPWQNTPLLKCTKKNSEN